MRKVYKKIKNEKKEKVYRRKLSIRAKISGTTDVPRVCAVRSNSNIQVQVVDDTKGLTLFSVQTFGKNKVGVNSNKDSAIQVGKAVADKLKKNKIEKAVFDRNGKKYSGVMAKIADAMRESGISI